MQNQKSQIVIYKDRNGNVKIDVRFDDGTVWLTQNALSELFQTTKQNVSQHIKNILEEGEMEQNSVVKEFFTTANDGKKYNTNYYNLDLIISLGYRVKSNIATAFRKWATERLSEYIVKGFVIDVERLKNPDLPFDYFEELERTIADIRASEKRFYRKITDIYATSIDYDPTNDQREKGDCCVWKRAYRKRICAKTRIVFVFCRVFKTSHFGIKVSPRISAGGVIHIT